jgi:hypothetical protein
VVTTGFGLAVVGFALGAVVATVVSATGSILGSIVGVALGEKTIGAGVALTLTTEFCCFSFPDELIAETHAPKRKKEPTPTRIYLVRLFMFSALSHFCVCSWFMVALQLRQRNTATIATFSPKETGNIVGGSLMSINPLQKEYISFSSFSGR